jgi:hypothetical protein
MFDKTGLWQGLFTLLTQVFFTGELELQLVLLL